MTYKKSNKNKLILITSIAAIVVMTFFFALSAKTNEGYRTIMVVDVIGRVSVVKDDIEYHAYPGMMLQEGHEIVTSGNSYVRLVLDNDKYIKLESGSKVAFEQLGMFGSGKTHIRLERGSLLSELVNPLGKNDEYVVNTPNAVLAVRGTFFRVDLSVSPEGDVLSDVLTYGGQVASKRVLPTGETVDEEVLIDGGYKATINMTQSDTHYVVQSNGQEKSNVIPISIDDISNEDLIDIYFAAENGHDLFVTAEEVKYDLEARDIDIEEETSIYDKVDKVIDELDDGDSAVNTTDPDVIANDSRPIVREDEEEKEDDTSNSDAETQAKKPLTDGDGHVHTKVAKTIDPTCTQSGKIVISCSTCKEVLSESVLEALGHSYASEYTIDAAATCLAEGQQSRHCVRCDSKVDVIALAKVDHNYSAWAQTVAPTCEVAGANTRTCSVCAATESQSIAALGHSYASDYTVDTAPTCTKDGKRSKHCKNAGCTSKIDTETLAALGHQDAGDGKTCAGCNKRYIAINAENFPDEGFRNRIYESYDQDKDNYMFDTELNAVTSININQSSDSLCSDLTGVGYFTEIKYLFCAYNDISELDLRTCPKLEWININGTAIASINDIKISDSAKIKQLEMSDTNIQYPAGCDVSWFGSITNFTATRANISTAKWNVIYEALPASLTSLMLQENGMSNSSTLEYLSGDIPVSKFTSIESLNVSENPEITSIDVSNCKSVKYLILAGTGIEEVTLNGHDQLVNFMVQDVNNSCVSLKTLNIDSCAKLSTLELDKCDSLETITVRECPELSIFTLNNCTNLRSLNLSGCTKIKSLSSLQAASSSLQSINVSRTGLQTLDATYLSSLLSIDARNCLSLTTINTGGSDNLTSLDVTGCTALTTINASGRSGNGLTITGAPDNCTIN